MRDLPHGGQVVLGILDVLEALRVVRLNTSLDEVLERLLVLVPLVHLGRGRLGLLGGGRRRGRLPGRLVGHLPGAGLLLAGLLLLAIALSLPAPGGRSGPRRRARLGGGAVVVVHPPHVVPQIPLPGEPVTGEGAFTAFIEAQIRLLAMAVHGVGLTLMPKEAGSRGEPSILATLNLAAVGLEMRVHKLAAVSKLYLVSADSQGYAEVDQSSRTRSCT